MELTDMQAEGEQQVPVNRTGIMTNPQLSAELINAAEETPPSSEGDATDLAVIRDTYIADAVPIGSVPVVLEVSGEGETDGPLVGMESLLDKLGERLAFERQGTRLYETVLQKCEALVIEDEPGPSIEDLRHICDEELEHFKMLQQAITKLGGDATMQTPSADIAGVLSIGTVQVVSDPRTTVPQMLQALLTAELVDNDGWQLLEDLAAELGQDELEEQCQKALEQEQEHLEKVREWVLSMAIDEAAAGAQLDDEEEDNEDAGQVLEQQEKESRKGKSSTSTGAKNKRKK